MSAPTRRALLLGAAGLALARAVPAAAQDRTVAAVQELLACEELAARAYHREGMGAFAVRTRDHVRVLETQLEAMGLLSFEVRGDELPAAGRLRDRGTALALERALLERHRDALGRIEEPAIRRTVATIMAAHAQRLVVLEANPLNALAAAGP